MATVIHDGTSSGVYILSGGSFGSLGPLGFVGLIGSVGSLGSYGSLGVLWTGMLLVQWIAGPADAQINTHGERRRRRSDVDPDEYLRHFGYMEGRGYWSHATRRERKEALRLYQETLGLPASGKVDKQTWRMMTSPRCGNPDMVPSQGSQSRRRRSLRNASSRRGGARGGLPADNNSFYEKWKKKDLTWKTNAYSKWLPKRTQYAIFNEVMRRWSEPSPLNIRYTDGEPDIEINFRSGQHEDGPANAFDGRGNMLAHAFGPGDSSMSGDIHFDNDEMWTFGVNSSRTRDLMNSAMHEAGHSLGLPHSTRREDVMFPVYLNYIPDPKLSYGDVKALHKQYGARQGYLAPLKITTTASPLQLLKRARFRSHKASPRWCRRKFNDIILGPDKFGYAFVQKLVYKLNNKGVVEGWPRPVRDVYPRAPMNTKAVVYIRETGKTYFFKGQRYWRYSNFTLDKGFPRKLPRPFAERPRAALAYRDHKGRSHVAMFGLKSTWRWDYRTEDHLGRYHLISSFWRGLPQRIDGAVEWSDHFIYFFSRNKYYKVSQRNRAVLKDYPRFKGQAWFGDACGDHQEPK